MPGGLQLDLGAGEADAAILAGALDSADGDAGDATEELAAILLFLQMHLAGPTHVIGVSPWPRVSDAV